MTANRPPDRRSRSAGRNVQICCTVIAVISVLLGIWGIHVSTSRGYVLAVVAAIALLGVGTVLLAGHLRSR
ncbi:MAG TPA: hypothetical protein VHX59_09190 [Mycobacteriales bacterium]|nr:hypothetical protein [Mycobacteriales bacterium]